MILRQFVDDDLGCASYLIADEKARKAVLVDPAYAIEPYLEEARRADVQIVRVLETHTHADHVAGHGRLALELGVPVSIHPAAAPEFPFDPLENGTTVTVGELELRILHTPGHRPEHCCFAVEDIVLTGDSLFVGGAARPDLAVDAREGAEGLFHSLRRIAELPNSTRVFPGHVAGSLCGAGMSSDTSSSIGAERRDNPALAHAAVEQFVRESSAVATPRPPNMEAIVELNRGPFLGAPDPLRGVDDAEGATILDVRPAEEFAAGHGRGAINVPLEGSGFGTRAGFVLSRGEWIALRAHSAEEAETAARRLQAVGFLELAGWLGGGPSSERLRPVELDELERLLAAGEVLVVDVREPSERDEAYIPGSRNVPYRLLRCCAETLATGLPVVTICESGARAAIAASLLSAAGVEARPVLHGGVPDWQSDGKPTTAFRRCGGHG